MTTRPLLRSSSSSVGVSAAVSVDSVTISRKWYRKPHSEHHAVRQGEHSILQAVQLARRRYIARREGTPVVTLSNLARAAPCTARASRVFPHLNHRSLHVRLRPSAHARHAPRQVLSARHAPQCTPAGSRQGYRNRTSQGLALAGYPLYVTPWQSKGHSGRQKVQGV